MHLQHNAWLDRFLARHHDAVVSEADGTAALYRRDQLLVAARHADRAHAAVKRWVNRRSDATGVTRLHLTPNAKVPAEELVAELRNHRDGSIAVTLNHFMFGEYGYKSALTDIPLPCGPLPRPLSRESGGRRPLIGILDTGILSHHWFAGSDWFGQVSPDQLDPSPFEVNYEQGTLTGHGTLVAGVIMSRAPDSFILLERALADDGVTDELELLRALSRLRSRLAAAGETLDVLNLSLGGYTLDNEPSPLLAEALARFTKQTVVVAASGNHGSNRPYWPAALKSCVAVAALGESHDRRAVFSNHGWWIDAAAPGSDVAGPFLYAVDVNRQRFDGFARWSGTGLAAPYVAGAIAELAVLKGIAAVEAADYVLDRSVGPVHPDFGKIFDSPDVATASAPADEPGGSKRRAFARRRRSASRDGAQSSGPETAVTETAPLHGSAPSGGDISVSVYLVDQVGHEAVRSAVEAYIEEIGAEIVEDHEPVIASWWWTAKAKKRAQSIADTDIARGAATLAESAAWGPVRSRQADINLINSQAVANLVNALGPASDGVIRIGSLLVVKRSGVPIVVMLSQVQVNELERRPNLLNSPETVLEELQRALSE